MCGICGFAGKPNELVLKSMMSRIVHRGPDDEGAYSDDRLSLGMRRLSILDLETGGQPIFNENKNLVTVFNGEIYNFEEIRSGLLKRGHRFYTDHSDTEVIVHLYEEYGLEFFHKLNGMFAIALWDKETGRLVLTRDRMGVKPLFYGMFDGVLVFGSEIKAMLAHPACKKEINYHAIHHYFTFKHVPAPLTAFKNIHALRPGELLVLENGQIETRKYWTIDFSKSTSMTKEEIGERIVDLLSDASRLRMRCDVPFGAYLSGGIDSSSVVAFMVKYASKPVVTFCMGYEDELKNKQDDLAYARKTSRLFGTDHHEYIMTQSEMLDDLEDVLGAFDQPFSGVVSTYFISKLIKKHVKVALSGDGGDELFASYLAHRLAQPMNVLKQEEGFPEFDRISSDKLAPFQKNLDYLKKMYALSKGDERTWRYGLYVFPDSEKNALYSKKMLSETRGLNSRSVLDGYFEGANTSDPLNRILFVDWNSLLPDQVLAFVDFLSMAHSIEVRSPYLDYRLVEFVAQIPGAMKIESGNVKAILKYALRDVLPADILNRPKEGFVQPSNFWLLTYYENTVRELLLSSKAEHASLFETGFVRHLIDEHYEKKADNSYKIWALVNFQIWHNKYFA